jgi:ubiquinone/menaquinone biosynthesis C-methylase UbiE
VSCGFYLPIIMPQKGASSLKIFQVAPEIFSKCTTTERKEFRVTATGQPARYLSYEPCSASAIMPSAAMGWLTLPRKPEPEVMGEADEVEAYASAAAQAYLDSVDNTLVEQVLSEGSRNTPAVDGSPLSGWLLDVGAGPGGIPLKIVRRCRNLCAVGVDRSLNMVRAARKSAAEQRLAERAFFLVADAARLCFPDAFFDFVLSNSLLHHLPNPVEAFNEMARVAKPSGVVLLRDLCRPSLLAFPLHVRWFGRYYSGLMSKLYFDSVRAAYTDRELAELLRRSALADARVFFHGRTHLGFIRRGSQPKGGAQAG